MKSFACAHVLVFSACLASAVDAQGTVALAEWSKSPVNGHYYLQSSAATWGEAESWARRIGGHLATVRSQAENDWISWMVPPFLPMWIGFNDERVEGSWEWASGEPVTYTNWAPGQPDNAGGVEDWARFHASAWYDEGPFVALGIIEVAPVAGVQRFARPTFSCNGPVFADVLRPPVSGDPGFGLSCVGAPPNAFGALLLANRRLTTPLTFGFTSSIWIDPFAPLFAAVLTGADSAGRASVAAPLPPGSEGGEAYVQFVWINPPGCAGAEPFSNSDGLHLVVQ